MDRKKSKNPFDFIIWGLKGYLEVIRRIKGLVLTKVKRLMLMDYTKYLLNRKRFEEIKINQRIVDLIGLLIKYEEVELEVFQVLPKVKALFSGVSNATKYRDIQKMKNLELISIITKNKIQFISPNFRKLDSIEYRIE